MIIPDIIVIPKPRVMIEVEAELNVPWLFTIDMDAIYSCVFGCFENINTKHILIGELMKSIHEDLFDSVGSSDTIGKHYVSTVVKNLVIELESYLHEYGLLEDEGCSYRYRGRLPDGDIILEKRSRDLNSSIQL